LKHILAIAGEQWYNMDDMKNQVFIDGQNLWFSTAKSDDPWTVDLTRFRVYVERKYDVTEAYYFIGYRIGEHEEMYRRIREAGYVLVFREHLAHMATKKKGNVDTDIVFSVMRTVAEVKDVDKIYLVSGDGDYFKMVQYLIAKGKFGRLLAPNEKRMSSLYKNFNPEYYAFLNRNDVKYKIARRNKKAGSS
jgi:uncharacterized LabA/DUF88 family protein